MSTIRILAVLLLVLSVVSSDDEERTGEYDFYKIFLAWPMSYCSSFGVRCYGEIIKEFVVRSLVPMYSSPEEIIVRPFNKTGCTTLTPETNIRRVLSGQFLEELYTNWPNLKFPEKPYENMEILRNLWRKHGMCFEFPEDPTHYFSIPLNLVKNRDILKILKDAAVEPDNLGGIIASEFSDAIENNLGEQVEIYCSKNKRGRLQFDEVGICMDKEHRQIPCTKDYIGCKANDVIWFPPAPEVSF